MADDTPTPMHRLNEKELRILLKRAIQKIPRSVIAELRGRADREGPAQDRAAQIIIDHFALAHHEVHVPEHHRGRLFG